ncbi:MAG TPA: DUF4369 domain-containing protein, partial [Flavisolibacter sp.]|nr:DUF4369 domain-containing protein [Flavisolibacter sp.]
MGITKHLFVFSFFLISTAVNAQKTNKGQFILQGTMPDQKEGQVYLSYPDKDGKYIRDSVAVNNGSFRFKGFISGPTLATFNGKMITRS